MARRPMTTSALNVLRSRRPVRAPRRSGAPKRPTPSRETGIYANPTRLSPSGLMRQR